MSKQRTRLLLIIVPVFLAAMVWVWLRSPVPEPDPATADALEAAAGKWWRPGEPSREVPDAEWPPELRRLGPRAVRVTAEGVFIRFGSRYVEEWGLFVLPDGSSYLPQSGTDPAFTLIRGRVYRYDIKG